MIQCCMHATTATNVPASKAFNAQFLSVQQQKGVFAGCSVQCAVCVAPRSDMCNDKCKGGCCQIKASVLSVSEFCSFSLLSFIKGELFKKKTTNMSLSN